MKHLISKTTTAVPVLALALAVGGCGSSSDDEMMPPEPTAQERCEGANGRYNADGSCTSAEELAAEAAAARAEMQRSEIGTAIDDAETAVAGLTDDASDTAISAAQMAVADAKTAVAGAGDIDADEKAAFNTAIGVVEGTLSSKMTSIMAAREAADEAMKAAMAKTGKELHAALGPNQGGATALTNIAAPTLTSAGLGIDAAAGAGALDDATDPALVTLTAGDSAGSLGGWMGMDYAHTDSGTKVMNAARVYTNQGAAKTVTFAAAGHTVATATTTDDFKGYLTLDEADTATLGRIMGDTFTHSGIQTHTYDSATEVAFTTRGTFDGAPGEYRCTGTCSSTNDGKGSPSALGGVWHFKPDAGAMVSQSDDHYLYYGWWVSKDEDGMPTAASAFAGRFGTDPGDSTDGLDTGGDLTALTGSATYTGNAAGKFAMSNVLDGTGNGGHFTADAMLEATFGTGTTAGVTGTIDNFRLNDGSEDPGWSVSLARGGLNTTGGITAPAADPTVWSINGNKAPASGTWSGTMYDETVGDDDDGSNLPTTVTGTFYSEFSTVGRMVGAFGADKE